MLAVVGAYEYDGSGDSFCIKNYVRPKVRLHSYPPLSSLVHQSPLHTSILHTSILHTFDPHHFVHLLPLPIFRSGYARDPQIARTDVDYRILNSSCTRIAWQRSALFSQTLSSELDPAQDPSPARHFSLHRPDRRQDRHCRPFLLCRRRKVPVNKGSGIQSDGCRWRRCLHPSKQRSVSRRASRVVGLSRPRQDEQGLGEK